MHFSYPLDYGHLSTTLFAVQEQSGHYGHVPLYSSPAYEMRVCGE